MTSITTKTTKAELIDTVKQLEGCVETMKERQMALAVVLSVVVLFNLLF